MIGKLDNIKTTDFTQISTPQEKIVQPSTAQQDPIVSHTAQEQMIATDRKQAFAITGVLYRSALDSQLTMMIQTGKPSVATGAISPDNNFGVGSPATLKRGSSGIDVQMFEYQLN